MVAARERLPVVVVGWGGRRLTRVKRAIDVAPFGELSDPWVLAELAAAADERGWDGFFGEVVDPRERAKLLDQGLDQLARFWGGEFEPVPAQQPRIPVWVAAEWPHRRALRWDGVFPIGLPNPGALAELVGEIGQARPASDPFDVVVNVQPDDDPAPWGRAGATWTLTDFGMQPTLAEVRAVIDMGPG